MLKRTSQSGRAEAAFSDSVISDSDPPSYEETPALDQPAAVVLDQLASIRSRGLEAEMQLGRAVYPGLSDVMNFPSPDLVGDAGPVKNPANTHIVPLSGSRRSLASVGRLSAKRQYPRAIFQYG